MRRLVNSRESLHMSELAGQPIRDQRARAGHEHVHVRDAMRHGILSAPSEAALREVAGIMAKHRVHAVAVTDSERTRPVGILSDVDLVTAIRSGEEPTAGQVAGTEPLAVSEDERLDRAVQMMDEHGVSHLVVLNAASGYPSGVISTLDIAAVYAPESA
jgi:predicted transcriptional regulator